MPESITKTSTERVVVLNTVAKAVVDSRRGIHEDFVFTYRGNPVGKLRTSAWIRAWTKAGLPISVPNTTDPEHQQDIKMLENLCVVITGAAGTLGQATAERARQLGARVIGLDIVGATHLDNIDEYRQLDLMDRQATAECFQSLGRVNVLTNIAGGFAMGDDSFDPASDQWDRMFKLNVDTMRNATMAAVPLLLAQGGGSIVNIGALAALSGQAGMSAYCCAKSSVMKLTESLSEELRHKAVNVNAVLPSIIDTPPNRAAMPDANFSEWVSPWQLANVICFLASDSASAIHGALIPVRGLA